MAKPIHSVPARQRSLQWQRTRASCRKMPRESGAPLLQQEKRHRGIRTKQRLERVGRNANIAVSHAVQSRTTCAEKNACHSADRQLDISWMPNVRGHRRATAMVTKGAMLHARPVGRAVRWRLYPECAPAQWMERRFGSSVLSQHTLVPPAKDKELQMRCLRSKVGDLWTPLPMLPFRTCERLGYRAI